MAESLKKVLKKGVKIYNSKAFNIVINIWSVILNIATLGLFDLIAGIGIKLVFGIPKYIKWYEILTVATLGLASPIEAVLEIKNFTPTNVRIGEDYYF